MTGGNQTLKVGTVGGSDIIINLNNFIDGGDLTPHAVELLLDYNMLCPPGYISRQGFGGQVANYPHVVPAGTKFITTKPEADALVAASAAQRIA